VPEFERDRDCAAAGLSEEIIERARLLLSPESREAADLIAYLHRSGRVDRMHKQMEEERVRWKLSGRNCGRSGRDASRDGFKSWKRNLRRCRSVEENVARVVEAVKERELRGSWKKLRGENWRGAKRGAGKLNAACADDLGVAAIWESAGFGMRNCCSRSEDSVRDFRRRDFAAAGWRNAEIRPGRCGEDCDEEIVGVESRQWEASSSSVASGSVSRRRDLVRRRN